MKRSMMAVVSVVAVMLAAGAAQATIITALPTTAGLDGTVVGVAGDYAPGWESGCWQANGALKAQFYMTPMQLFGRDNVTVGELASITYFTKKDTTHVYSAPDWFLQVYTAPYTGGHKSWYGDRINTEPYFSQNIVETAGAWNQWVTGAGQNNRLRFFDSSDGYYGGYGDGFLSDLTGNSAYSNQVIKFFTVGTGSGWANGFTGKIDGLTIQLTGSGGVGGANFTPEPATMALLAAGGIGMLLRRRRNK